MSVTQIDFRLDLQASVGGVSHPAIAADGSDASPPLPPLQRANYYDQVTKPSTSNPQPSTLNLQPSTITTMGLNQNPGRNRTLWRNVNFTSTLIMRSCSSHIIIILSKASISSARHARMIHVDIMAYPWSVTYVCLCMFVRDGDVLFKWYFSQHCSQTLNLAVF
jgi:hypothetical protein